MHQSDWSIKLDYIIVLQLVLGIAVMSPASLEYCVNGSFITRLLGELAGDDVLIR